MTERCTKKCRHFIRWNPYVSDGGPMEVEECGIQALFRSDCPDWDDRNLLERLRDKLKKL